MKYFPWSLRIRMLAVSSFALLLMWMTQTVYAQVQPGDLLSLKKKNGKNIHTFLKGSFISFRDISGRKVQGQVRQIRNDSIFIQQYDVRRGYTMWGTSVLDTLTSLLLRYHYREIAAIDKPPQSFEFVRNGTLFMLAGGAYASLHLINSLIQKDNPDLTVVAISGGVAALGFLMKKTRRYEYIIGRRYRLIYTDMSH